MASAAAPAGEPVEACAESLSVAWWSQCHCAVAARSNLRESGAATMSALNLWNRNTERVADALSRDNHPIIKRCENVHLMQLAVSYADKPHYVRL